MKNDNQKKSVSYTCLNFNFDDRALYELGQKLFKGELTLDEFKKRAHELVVD